MTGLANNESRDVIIRARAIPPPTSISEAARAALAALVDIQSLPECFPERGDTAGWLQLIETQNAATAAAMRAQPMPAGVKQETIKIHGATVYKSTPTGDPERLKRRVHLDIHGGALILMGGEVCRILAAGYAALYDALTFSPDYRVAPIHPYPAGLDDCVDTYRGLVEKFDPADIIISGWSAGSNLAAATVLRARDEGLPLPAALVLPTPEVDLTESGDTFEVMKDIDVVLKRGLMPINMLYANGADLSHPYLSPLFGDFAKGFPPTFLQAGTRDMFLSNAARMHRALLAARVPAELHVFEAMPHGGFMGATPEDNQFRQAIREFMDRYWTMPGRRRDKVEDPS